MEAYEKVGSAGWKNKKIQQTQHPEVTEMLDLWVEKALASKIHLTGNIIRQKWIDFADQLAITQDDCLKLSNGWLTSYKSQMGIKEFRRHDEAGGVDMVAVEAERAQLKEIIDGYKPCDTYNMDETGLFYV